MQARFLFFDQTRLILINKDLHVGFFPIFVKITMAATAELAFQFDLIQSYSAGAKNFTNYVFCHPQFSVHPQFSGVIQNIENHCAINAKP